MDEPEPDELIPVPISTIIDEWVAVESQEVAYKSGIGGLKNEYPSYAVLRIILTALAIDFPNLLEQYEKKEKELDKLYGDVVERKFNLYTVEADERHKNILLLWHQLGPGRIDTRGAYSTLRPPDNIDFSGWDDNK